MAARTIITSQPDVACEVCERRLLRGEQPDVFVVAGRRRIVCELCAPRAAHEGWMRESDSQSLTLPPMRPRRGRSLFERLPVPFRVRQVGAPRGTPQGAQAGRPAGETDAAGGASAPDLAEEQTHAEAHGHAEAHLQAPEPPPSDPQGHDTQELVGADPADPAVGIDPAIAAVSAPFDVEADAATENSADVEISVDAETAAEGEAHPEGHSETRDAPEEPSAYVEQAIAVFNASEFPRRVAGVARSLGAPSVTVRSAEHLSSVVSIVVAWELCWYRYEVDLSEPVVEAQVIAQGTELAELAREDRRANAAAGESGLLALAAA